MSYVPHWIGYAGFVLSMIFCVSFLAGQLWLAVLLGIPCIALIVLENRYERGLIGTRRG
jgi:hypothetical protein